ncbi:MAG: hypothetical protein WBZ36_08510 [Candidatus Nitrosopolaris sp.]
MFTGKLESIPNKCTNQSEGLKGSGCELILYDVIEDEDGNVSIDT